MLLLRDMGMFISPSNGKPEPSVDTRVEYSAVHFRRKVRARTKGLVLVIVIVIVTVAVAVERQERGKTRKHGQEQGQNHEKE